MEKLKSSKGKFFGSYLASEQERIEDELEDKIIKVLEKQVKEELRSKK